MPNAPSSLPFLQVAEWASIIHTFARTYGLSDSVMTLDDLSNGDDVRGTELQGLHREVVTRALRVLEGQGRARSVGVGEWE